MMTEQNFDAPLLGNRTNLESHESRTSEGQQLVLELRSKVKQMRASAARDLEAKIESQKSAIQRLQRDLQSAQDSLNSWDEVNLNWIQGVCVDETVGTSTSSVKRMTEPAITHLPQASCDLELLRQRAFSAERSNNIGCSSEYATASISNAPMTDNMLESLFKMEVEMSDELLYLLQFCAQETTYGDKKYDHCSLKLMVQRHLEQNTKDSRFKARNRDEDRPAMGAPIKGEAKEKGQDTAKNNRKLHPLDGTG